MNKSDQSSKTFLLGVFQETWYLFVILAILLVVGIISYMRSTNAPAVRPTTIPIASPRTTQPIDKDQSPVDTMRAAPPEEEIKNIMADNQQKFDTSPKSPDAPAYLCANGNLLATKLKDYKGAIQIYERILSDYPEYKGMLVVYLGLEECYKQLNDQARLQWLYKQMMEKCDPESAEYQYAKGKLGL